MRRKISVLLAFGVLLSLGGCRNKKPADPPVQHVEPEYSLEIVEAITGKPATRTAAELPADTTQTTAAATALTSGSAATQTEESKTEASSGTAKSKKKKKKKNTVTTTDYLSGIDLTTSTETVTVEATIDKDGVYTTKDDVALYIYTYGELPSNFITKKEAQKLGWEGGSLEPYAPGCCIGGSYFGNYEGSLPEKKGREYTECDIDTLGKDSRGAKRIVFSNDGLIYYTGDHYKTFELLYGEE